MRNWTEQLTKYAEIFSDDKHCFASNLEWFALKRSSNNEISNRIKYLYDKALNTILKT